MVTVINKGEPVMTTKLTKIPAKPVSVISTDYVPRSWGGGGGTGATVYGTPEDINVIIQQDTVRTPEVDVKLIEPVAGLPSSNLEIPTGSQLGGGSTWYEDVMDFGKEKVSSLVEAYPRIDLTKEEGRGFVQQPAPFLIEKDVVPTGMPSTFGGTPQMGTPTSEELTDLGFHKESAKKELEFDQIKTQVRLDTVASEIAQDIADSLKSQGEEKINTQFDSLQAQVNQGKTSQTSAQKQLDSYVNKVNKEVSNSFNTQFSAQMKPIISAEQAYTKKTADKLFNKMNKRIDRKNLGLKFAGGFLTGALYGVVGTLAPPVGVALMGLGLTELGIKRKEVVEGVKQQPLTFGTNVAGMLIGGYTGAKFTGIAKGKYLESKFMKQARKAKIKVVGFEKDFSGKFAQEIIGTSKIAGKNYIVRISARGVKTSTGALAKGKGYVLRVGKTGSVESMTGYQTLGRAVKAGKAFKVKLGDAFNVKQLIGRGFLSQGIARTTYHVNLHPPRITTLGRIQIGKGFKYFGSKFKSTKKMAGAYSSYGKDAIRFVMGEKKPKYVYRKTPFGWTYSPEKAMFQPRIRGWLFKVGGKGNGKITTGKIASGKTTVLKLDSFTQQVTTIPALITETGKSAIKASIKPIIKVGTLTSTATISQATKIQQKNMQGLFSSNLLSGKLKGESESKYFSGLFEGFKLISEGEQRFRNPLIIGLRQPQPQVVVPRVTPTIPTVNPSFVFRPIVPTMRVIPKFLGLPKQGIFGYERRKARTRKLYKQRRAYQPSVGAVALGITISPKRAKKLPKMFTGLELRPVIRKNKKSKRKNTAMGRKLKNIFGF